MSRCKISSIIGAITLVFFLFLPFLSSLGQSANVADLLGEVGFDFFFETDVGIGISSLVIIISAVAIIVSGLMGKSTNTVVFSIVGAIATLVLIITVFDFLQFMGSAVWFTLAGFVVNFFVSLG